MNKDKTQSVKLNPEIVEKVKSYKKRNRSITIGGFIEQAILNELRSRKVQDKILKSI